MQTKLFIDGKLVQGEGDAELVLDPATGLEIARVPEASPAQVAEAVAAAERAFPAWSRTSPKDRSLALLRLADAIEARGEAFAEVESLNCGKPLAAVIADEIPAIVDVLRFFAGAVRAG